MGDPFKLTHRRLMAFLVIWHQCQETRAWRWLPQDSYLMPMTMESGPTRCSTRVSRNPASFIHAEQSAPV